MDAFFPSATGRDSPLLIKEGWKFPFIARARAAFATFGLKPDQLLPEGSILAQQLLLFP